MKKALKTFLEMGLKAKSFMDEGKLTFQRGCYPIVKEKDFHRMTALRFIARRFPKNHIPQAEALDKMGVEGSQYICQRLIFDERTIEAMSGTPCLPKIVANLITSPIPSPKVGRLR